MNKRLQEIKVKPETAGEREALIAKLRYMGRQYATAQASRAGSTQKHYLEEAADEIERLAALSREAQPVGPEPTQAMVTAYLQANDAYWKAVDEDHSRPDVWRNGTPNEATRVSLKAALAAAPQAGQPPERALELLRELVVLDRMTMELAERKNALGIHTNEAIKEQYKADYRAFEQRKQAAWSAVFAITAAPLEPRKKT